MEFIESIGRLLAGNASVAALFTTLMRFVFPLLAFLILFRCARSLLTFRRQPEIWAWLNIAGMTSRPVTHWENIIGRGKGSDIVVDLKTISRSHAVLARHDDGSWTISDVGSKGGVQVGEENVTTRMIDFGEVFMLGGVEFWLERVTREEQKEQAEYRTRPGAKVKPDATLFYLTVFQILAMLQFVLHVGAADIESVIIGFSALIIL
ncbi:MAG: FHA domain-containing protein, partial [Oscillospiraceae bacterium]|nr:FHA domain-containing protein [Oscillospiraceae bacterium]